MGKMSVEIDMTELRAIAVLEKLYRYDASAEYDIDHKGVAGVVVEARWNGTVMKIRSRFLCENFLRSLAEIW